MESNDNEMVDLNENPSDTNALSSSIEKFNGLDELKNAWENWWNVYIRNDSKITELNKKEMLDAQIKFNAIYDKEKLLHKNSKNGDDLQNPTPRQNVNSLQLSKKGGKYRKHKNQHTKRKINK